MPSWRGHGKVTLYNNNNNNNNNKSDMLSKAKTVTVPGKFDI
jgi:hypothetical protein